MEGHRVATQTMAPICRNEPPRKHLGEDRPLLVHLDYRAGVVQHADNCPIRARTRAIFRVRDRVADRIGACIPDRAVPKTITNQIKAISVLAGTHLINVVAGRQPKAVLFGTLRFHSVYFVTILQR
jgi:hypothetical protein